jgi:hypothetical protein
MFEDYDEKSVKELIDKYGKKSLREAMTTGSANVAVPALVAARTLYYLNTFPDVKAEQYLLIEEAPEGSGKVYSFQVLTSPTYQEWTTEGTAISPADITLEKPQVTLKQYGQATFLSDLLQSSSVFSFTEAVGKAHGEAVRKAINDLAWTALRSGTDNVVTGGTKGDATVYSPTINNIWAIKKKVMLDVFKPDYLVSGVTAWDSMLTANWTNVQLSGALVQWITSGNVQQLVGLDIVVDPLYPDGTGADGEPYMSCGVKGLSVGMAQRGGVITEIERNAKAIGQDIVTHIVAGFSLMIDKSTGTIKHAA